MPCNEALVEKPKAPRCPRSSFAQLQPSSDPLCCTAAALVLLALRTI